MQCDNITGNPNLTECKDLDFTKVLKPCQDNAISFTVNCKGGLALNTFELAKAIQEATKNTKALIISFDSLDELELVKLPEHVLGDNAIRVYTPKLNETGRGIDTHWTDELNVIPVDILHGMTREGKQNAVIDNYTTLQHQLYQHITDTEYPHEIKPSKSKYHK